MEVRDPLRMSSCGNHYGAKCIFSCAIYLFTLIIYLFIYLFIYTRKIISTNMLKTIIKKLIS